VSHHEHSRCPLKLRDRYATRFLEARAARATVSAEQADESLVADARSALTPSDMVEQKLLHLLRGASVASCHIRMAGNRARGRAND
jgi:hypothetical protein